MTSLTLELIVEGSYQIAPRENGEETEVLYSSSPSCLLIANDFSFSLFLCGKLS